MDQLNMRGWKELQEQASELAEFGAERLKNKVAYLATVAKEERPRVHPVAVILGEGYLFVFMEPTSPKAHDLRKNGRFALHSSVTDTSGSNGEFTADGRASLVSDPQLRATAARLSWYKPKESFILFTLFVETAMGTIYSNGKAVRKRWTRSSP
jgi:hypothetical protein